MAVPGVVLLIPKFLVLNYLGIYDTYPALVLPLLVDAAGVFIMKQFFESIPASVEEAARIDGAGTFRTFWSVVLPMARPALITLTILSFQGSWNELPHFIIATQDPDLFTLTRGVATLTRAGSGRDPVPDHDGRRTAHDHPGRHRLLHLPALLHPGRERRRREGLSHLGRGPEGASTPPRTVRVPGSVWCRARAQRTRLRSTYWRMPPLR